MARKQKLPKVPQSPKAKSKIKTVMREFKKGKLHSGRTHKPVTKQKQAVAIAISEARKATKKKK